jgi:hypothetical protein
MMVNKANESRRICFFVAAVVLAVALSLGGLIAIARVTKQSDHAGVVIGDTAETLVEEKQPPAITIVKGPYWALE